MTGVKVRVQRGGEWREVQHRPIGIRRVGDDARDGPPVRKGRVGGMPGAGEVDPGEPTIYARVAFSLDGAALVAELGRDGWSIPGAGPELAELPAFLGRAATVADYGPADGDPVYRAAAVAAEMLCGRITWVRPVDDPPDVDY